MNERELELIVSNDKEWRKHILRDLENVKKEIVELRVLTNTLKVKYGMIATVFGIFGGIVGKYLKM